MPINEPKMRRIKQEKGISGSGEINSIRAISICLLK
jgi:hypothetical protein